MDKESTLSELCQIEIDLSSNPDSGWVGLVRDLEPQLTSSSLTWDASGLLCHLCLRIKLYYSHKRWVVGNFIYLKGVIDWCLDQVNISNHVLNIYIIKLWIVGVANWGN